jgi:hypothetical protein
VFDHDMTEDMVPEDVDWWLTAAASHPDDRLPDGIPPLTADAAISICRYDEIVPGQATVWSVVAKRLLANLPTTLVAPLLRKSRMHWVLAGVFVQRDVRTGAIHVTPFAGDTLAHDDDGIDDSMMLTSARFLARLTAHALHVLQQHMPVFQAVAGADEIVCGDEVFDFSKDLLDQEDGTICGYAVLAAMLSAVGKPPNTPADGWHGRVGQHARSHWLPMANDATQRNHYELRMAIHIMSLAACRFPVCDQLPPSDAIAMAYTSHQLST